MSSKGQLLVDLYKQNENEFSIPALTYLDELWFEAFWRENPRYLERARVFHRDLMGAFDGNDHFAFLRKRYFDGSFLCHVEAFLNTRISNLLKHKSSELNNWAVRSSGLEDLANFLGAGAFETRLGVTTADLPRAIAEVIASYFEPSAYAQAIMYSTRAAPRDELLTEYISALTTDDVPKTDIIIQEMFCGSPLGLNTKDRAPLLSSSLFEALGSMLSRLGRQLGMAATDSEWIVNTSSGAVSIVATIEKSDDGRSLFKGAAAFGAGAAVKSTNVRASHYKWTEDCDLFLCASADEVLEVETDGISLSLLQIRSLPIDEKPRRRLSDKKAAWLATHARRWPIKSVLVGGDPVYGRVIVARDTADALQRFYEPLSETGGPVRGVVVGRGSSLDHPALVFRQMGVSVLLMEINELSIFASELKSDVVLIAPYDLCIYAGLAGDFLINEGDTRLATSDTLESEWGLLSSKYAHDNIVQEPPRLDWFLKSAIVKELKESEERSREWQNVNNNCPPQTMIKGTYLSWRQPSIHLKATLITAWLNRCSEEELITFGWELFYGESIFDHLWRRYFKTQWAKKYLGGKIKGNEIWSHLGFSEIQLESYRRSDGVSEEVKDEILLWESPQSRAIQELGPVAELIHVSLLSKLRDFITEMARSSKLTDIVTFVKNRPAGCDAEMALIICSYGATIPLVAPWATREFVLKISAAQQALRGYSNLEMDDIWPALECLKSAVFDSMGAQGEAVIVANLVDEFIEIADNYGKSLAMGLSRHESRCREDYRALLLLWYEFAFALNALKPTSLSTSNLFWCLRELSKNPTWDVSLGYNETWKSRIQADLSGNLHQIQNNLHQGTLEIRQRLAPFEPTGWLGDISALAKSYPVRENYFTKMRPCAAEILLGLTIHETVIQITPTEWTVEFTEPPSSRHTYRGNVGRLRAIEAILRYFFARLPSININTTISSSLGDAWIKIDLASATVINGQDGYLAFLYLLTTFEASYQFSGEPTCTSDHLPTVLHRNTIFKNVIDRLPEYRNNLDATGYNPDPQINRFSVAITHLCIFRSVFYEFGDNDLHSSESFLAAARKIAAKYSLSVSSNEIRTLAFVYCLLFEEEAYLMVKSGTVSIFGRANIFRHVLQNTKYASLYVTRSMPNRKSQYKDLWQFNSWFMIKRCMLDKEFLREQADIVCRMKVSDKPFIGFVGYFIGTVLEAECDEKSKWRIKLWEYVEHMQIRHKPMRIGLNSIEDLNVFPKDDKLVRALLLLPKVDIRFSENATLE
ncbi:hypothetical protein LAV84_23935 [Rhizobium sp. VS19-DR104.2]|uniref:hypothetical protein n=1 Tax=unclassified Rhizobium TaxID=2613769 RepID=UPI001CC6448C|nr:MULTISPECIES: hypothetical protein [unclassified Rhizobium]MBZ5762310.1 hypothetical protein [Rhizobium sp. VS19-DR96]MBZ5768326.1 hypothetical protein [Rhizobium sp. VS19-DR129.2]MBZ5775802.1 hypothetical protein [Rhizobium sp. VS19-DRK62.2]MBZ5787177.1 hypothetical protein [Rhizobium sp. VS19-DR121]MBZ5804252.1 hypothetical protein [Rhizobium sp. VS19-DR181]